MWYSSHDIHKQYSQGEIIFFYPENTYLFVCGVTVNGVTIKIV